MKRIDECLVVLGRLILLVLFPWARIDLMEDY
jgi:hypothetical protein